MPEGYLHLTCEQRCQIYALLQSGRSQAHIARQIGVDPSTISRELVRNTGARGYRFKQAHEKASQRRQEASDKPRKMTPDLVELIEEKLTQEQWSPDQISGRLAKDGVAFISHERIYQHVWKDKKDGGTLYLHLRHSGKKYNRRKGKNSGRGLIPNRVDIDQRPPIVAAKSRIGDWEADTIIGANHKGVVMSHVERTSKYTKLAKLPDKNADSVVQACARVLLPLADQIETITYDNGKEFAAHAQIATSLGALSYFAKPYHSWERGLNEHTNGLFRQYFPKGSDFSILSDADVQRVEDKLNSRPRKILGYQTPREIFFSARNLPCCTSDLKRRNKKRRRTRQLWRSGCRQSTPIPDLPRTHKGGPLRDKCPTSVGKLLLSAGAADPDRRRALSPAHLPIGHGSFGEMQRPWRASASALRSR